MEEEKDIELNDNEKVTEEKENTGLKANKRFTEIITSYTINRICNYVNRKKYKEHITIINDLLKSIDDDYEGKFVDLFNNSYNEQIVGASKKEIYAAMKSKYRTPKKMASKMGLSRYRFNNVYKDLIFRNFITEEWLNTLVPICDEKTYEMCRVLNNFIDNFQYLAGEPYYNHYDLFRCMELEFYIIHSTLSKILGSTIIVEKFLYNVCMDLEIDWATISYLLRNLNLISRSTDIQMYGNKQLKQEIFNLMYLKGFNKGDVGEYIFNKDRKTYYGGGYEYLTKDITKDDFEFSMTMSPTLDWAPVDKDTVLKFIDIFRDFSNERL